MTDVSLEMQALQERMLDELASFRDSTTRELRLINGCISILDRRVTGIASAIRSGADIAADLQSQIDGIADPLDRLENAGGAG